MQVPNAELPSCVNLAKLAATVFCAHTLLRALSLDCQMNHGLLVGKPLRKQARVPRLQGSSEDKTASKSAAVQ